MRSYIRKIAKPGIKLIDMCETLEDSVRRLIGARGLDAGMFIIIYIFTFHFLCLHLVVFGVSACLVAGVCTICFWTISA